MTLASSSRAGAEASTQACPHAVLRKLGPGCPSLAAAVGGVSVDGPLVACVPGERLFQTDGRGSQGRPPEQSTSTRMTYSRDGRLSGHRQVGMPIG
jgi:hypothetical protein